MIKHPRRLDAHQKIALAVILQAFSDAASRELPLDEWSDAREFIADSPRLVAWCHVAGIDPAFMRDVSGRFFRSLMHVVPAPGIAEAMRSQGARRKSLDRPGDMPVRRRVH